MIAAAVVSLAGASTALEPASHRPVRREYNLCQHKAEAIYKLLAPGYVKVIVGRHPNGVWIKGRPWEAAAIDDLVELVSRWHHQSHYVVRSYMADAFQRSETRASYSLPRRQREALHELLALDDVPVECGVESSRLTVRATEQDQRTIDRVVRIISGRRSSRLPGGIACLLGWHSEGCGSQPGHGGDYAFEFAGVRLGAAEAKIAAFGELKKAKAIIRHSLPPEHAHSLSPADTEAPGEGIRIPMPVVRPDDLVAPPGEDKCLEHAGKKSKN